jgi:hypothetical protein
MGNASLYTNRCVIITRRTYEEPLEAEVRQHTPPAQLDEGFLYSHRAPPCEMHTVCVREALQGGVSLCAQEGRLTVGSIQIWYGQDSEPHVTVRNNPTKPPKSLYSACHYPKVA